MYTQSTKTAIITDGNKIIDVNDPEFRQFLAAGGVVEIIDDRYVDVKTITAEHARIGLAKIDLLNEVEAWAKLNEAAYAQYLVADEWRYGNPFIEAAIAANVISRAQVDAIFNANT